MKNAFDGLINRLNTAEQRISELEDISTEMSKTEKQRKKRRKNKNRREYPRSMAQPQKCNICVTGIPKGKHRQNRFLC